MAVKTSYYTTICLLLFLLLLLSYLHISPGAEDSQAYDIDYRGPETHPSMAPPSHFPARPWARRRDFREPPKSDNLRSPYTRPKGGVKKIKG